MFTKGTCDVPWIGSGVRATFRDEEDEEDEMNLPRQVST